MGTDSTLESINEASQLVEIIKNSKYSNPECDEDQNSVIHNLCFDSKNNDRQIALCRKATNYLIFRILASKPNLINDDTKSAFCNYLNDNEIKARDLIRPETLSLLNSTKTPSTTWIKFESLLIRLIKEGLYEPKTMASEILSTVKHELDPTIAARFSSVIGGCVKHCREYNNGSSDEEEEHKWSEIIDWMSWFLGDSGEGFD